MHKSFVLSGGRKNDRFESGFKPATLPDWQNGNVRVEAPSLFSARSTAVLWAPMQLPETTIANQSFLKTGFRNASHVEVFSKVSSMGCGRELSVEVRLVRSSGSN